MCVCKGILFMTAKFRMIDPWESAYTVGVLAYQAALLADTVQATLPLA